MIASRPSIVHVTSATIPDELKQGRRWVNWRLESRANVSTGETKRTKVPYRPDGRTASSTDPATWSTFNDVWAAYRRGGFDGVGIVLSKDSGLVGVDLDHVRAPATGVIESWAAEYIGLLDSYTEISPSGSGLRIFIRATLPPGRKKKGGVEMYNSGRFLTVTGYLMPGTRGTVEHRQDALEELRLRVFGPSTPPSKPRDYRATGRVESAQIESALSYIQADDRENWLIVGMALHSSLGAAGRSIWDSWSATRPSTTWLIRDAHGRVFGLTVA